VVQEDEEQTAEDKTQPGEQPTLEPTGEPTAVPEPEETQKPEPEETKEPESGQTQEPESEQAQQPQPKPAPAYATQAELDAAFEAVGVADELEAVTAAVEAYIAVYNRLSPQDQAANAEALAYAQSYLETLRQAAAAGQTGEEFTDPEIETMAAKWHTITLVPASTNSYSSKITSAKVKVGDKVGGYEVTSVSGTTIKVKAWGDLYGDFFLPRAADLWNGAVKSDYVVWAATGNQQKTEGGSAMLPQSNASAHYYFNTAGSVVGGDGTESYVWKFTLNYDANGGTGAPAAQTYGTNNKYESSHDFTVSSVVPTRSGYTFLGWSTTRSGTVNYKAGNSYHIAGSGFAGGSVTKTLYAVWQKDAEKVTLTYIDRGATYKTETYDKGATATIISCINTNTGYKFVGWSANPNATEADWEPGNTMALSSSATLYAVWQKTGPVDDGAGISVSKTRVSINDDASKTTAEPGDTIEWEIKVTNNSNVPKTVTLTEQLVGASLSATQVTIDPGKSKTVTATYTVKKDDKGKTITNKVVASTGTPGEDKTAQDGGTPVAPVIADYTVQWYDTYGNQIQTDDTRNSTVGTTVMVKEGDKTVAGYTFDEKNPGNLTEAVLAASGTVLKLYFIKQVTVTWRDEDQTVLHGPITVDGDKIPAANEYGNLSGNKNPTKAEDSDNTYEFARWDKTTDGDGNVTYTATYKAVPKTPAPTASPTPAPTPSTSPDPADPTPTPDPADPTPTPDPADPTPTPDPADPTPTPAPADPTPTPAPGGTTDPADPDDPDDPAPAPAPTAVPVAPPPVIPAPAGPVVPVTPAAPAAEMPEEETPLAASAAPAPTATPAPAGVEDLGDDEGTPLAGPGRAAWALVNLILTVLTVLASILLLIGFMGKKQKELRDDNGNLVTDAEGNPVYEWTKKRHGGVRTFSLVPAIAAVVAFILTEDMRLPMILVDRWTPLMLLIALVQLAVCFFARKSKDEMDEEDGTPGGPAPARA